MTNQPHCEVVAKVGIFVYSMEMCQPSGLRSPKCRAIRDFDCKMQGLDGPRRGGEQRGAGGVELGLLPLLGPRTVPGRQNSIGAGTHFSVCPTWTCWEFVKVGLVAVASSRKNFDWAGNECGRHAQRPLFQLPNASFLSPSPHFFRACRCG